MSKVKTRLNSTQDLKLPIGTQSIVGYVAMVRRMVNIGGVYEISTLNWPYGVFNADNNSAPEFITRLLDMGMDRFDFADALLGILAQRLAKKLCDCKESYLPSAQELKYFIKEYAEELRHSDAWKTDADG